MEAMAHHAVNLRSHPYLCACWGTIGFMPETLETILALLQPYQASAPLTPWSLDAGSQRLLKSKPLFSLRPSCLSALFRPLGLSKLTPHTLLTFLSQLLFWIPPALL